MNYLCSLCGNQNSNIVFKGGYVCDDCLRYIRTLPRESDSCNRCHELDSHVFIATDTPKPVLATQSIETN